MEKEMQASYQWKACGEWLVIRLLLTWQTRRWDCNFTDASLLGPAIKHVTFDERNLLQFEQIRMTERILSTGTTWRQRDRTKPKLLPELKRKAMNWRHVVRHITGVVQMSSMAALLPFYLWCSCPIVCYCDWLLEHIFTNREWREIVRR